MRPASVECGCGATVILKPSGPLPKSCRSCARKRHKANMTPEQRRADLDAQRRSWLRLNYGITPDEYERLAARGCNICGAPEPGAGRTYFDIDHCHETGRVRGALCRNCNTGVGKFQDAPTLLLAAAAYLLNA